MTFAVAAMFTFAVTMLIPAGSLASVRMVFIVALILEAAAVLMRSTFGFRVLFGLALVTLCVSVGITVAHVVSTGATAGDAWWVWAMNLLAVGVAWLSRPRAAPEDAQLNTGRTTDRSAHRDR